jgi:hypothetical protein
MHISRTEREHPLWSKGLIGMIARGEALPAGEPVRRDDPFRGTPFAPTPNTREASHDKLAP